MMQFSACYEQYQITALLLNLVLPYEGKQQGCMGAVVFVTISSIGHFC